MNTVSSVQFSCSVVSDSLGPYESQHARPPCPSPTPRVHSDSRPSSQWCHPAISSSDVPFSSCLQSLPASVFSNESTLLMTWPKDWSFSFSIIRSKEIQGYMLNGSFMLTDKSRERRQGWVVKGSVRADTGSVVCGLIKSRLAWFTKSSPREERSAEGLERLALLCSRVNMHFMQPD